METVSLDSNSSNALFPTTTPYRYTRLLDDDSLLVFNMYTYYIINEAAFTKQALLSF